ncbi:MAG TPA: TolC family protein [Deltaproteobacteria bacterium]|nr:TolC family protein [Deltaproteobacteria bacterium]
MKLSQENLAIAEFGTDKALSVLIPRFSAYGNYTRFEEEKYNEMFMLIQPKSAGQWGLRLDQQFSLSLREHKALSFSKENVVKSGQDLDAAREEYLFQVAGAYYDVLKAQKGLEIANANLERLAKYRDAADKRLKVGEVTKTVLLRAEAELSSAKSDLVRAENGLKYARVILARIVGIEGDFTLKEEPETVDRGLALDQLKDLAYAQRPDLKSLAHEQKMAELQVSYAKGAFWPNVALSGVYQKADQSPATASLVKDTLYGSVGVSFPFFEGGLRRAELSEAKARERQARYAYEDLKKTIGMEVDGAYLGMITQKGSLAYLADQLRFAKDNYRAVSRQFEVGLASSLDVMDANNLLVASERQLADATYTYQLSILRIKKVTGSLLRELSDHKTQG